MPTASTKRGAHPGMQARMRRKNLAPSVGTWLHDCNSALLVHLYVIGLLFESLRLVSARGHEEAQCDGGDHNHANEQQEHAAALIVTRALAITCDLLWAAADLVGSVADGEVEVGDAESVHGRRRPEREEKDAHLILCLIAPESPMSPFG